MPSPASASVGFLVCWARCRRRRQPPGVFCGAGRNAAVSAVVVGGFGFLDVLMIVTPASASASGVFEFFSNIGVRLSGDANLL